MPQSPLNGGTLVFFSGQLLEWNRKRVGLRGGLAPSALCAAGCGTLNPSVRHSEARQEVPGSLLPGLACPTGRGGPPAPHPSPAPIPRTHDSPALLVVEFTTQGWAWSWELGERLGQAPGEGQVWTPVSQGVSVDVC